MPTDSNHCPKCGAVIAADAPQGLCPKCLLAAVSAPTEPASPTAIPSREELARAFPHLEVLELVGQGGMGCVFKARQPKLDRFVALKILSQPLGHDPAFAERFTREGRVLARLNHPNIVTVHDFGQAGGFFYLLMEFVDGVNLREAMRAGRFTPEQALAVVPKICDALQYAHGEGILHRDIKPENILLDGKGRVKIADFGIAKLVGDAPAEMHLTGQGATLGTPHYMAPEQLERPSTVDHRADIYSLGVVFYEMLTGELPLGRFAPPSQKSQADPRLDDVVFRTLEKEPERRAQSAGEVKTAVENIARDPAAPVQTPESWPRRLRRAVPYGVITFLLCCGAAVMLASIWPRTFAAKAMVVWNPPDNGLPLDDALQVELRRLASRRIAEQVVERYGLVDRWSTADSRISFERAVERLRRSLGIRMPRGARVAEVMMFSRDPAEAALLANAIAETYMRLHPESNPGMLESAAEPRVHVRPNRVRIVLGGVCTGGLAGSAVMFLLAWVRWPRRALNVEQRIVAATLAVGVVFMILITCFVAVRQLGASAIDATRYTTYAALTLSAVAVVVGFLRDRHRTGQRQTRWWLWFMIFGSALGLAAFLLRKPADEQSPVVAPKSQVESRKVAAAPEQRQLAQAVPAATKALLDEPPQLRFVAWQDQFDPEKKSGAFRADGSAPGINDWNLLSALQSGGLDVSSMVPPARRPRILRLWFSHPLFGEAVAMNLTTTNGTLLPLCAQSSLAINTTRQGDLGWVSYTVCAGEGANVPLLLDVELRYAIGELANRVKVKRDFRGLLTLDGDGQVAGVGEDSDGRAFIAIAVNASELPGKRYGAVAVLRDGRELIGSASRSGPSDGRGWSITRFTFPSPLSEVEEFVLGTRAVRIARWRGVKLPPLDSPAKQ
jgi:tRNA A-37 threonylcarbamoyl transferase component Bud32